MQQNDQQQAMDAIITKVYFYFDPTNKYTHILVYSERKGFRKSSRNARIWS